VDYQLDGGRFIIIIRIRYKRYDIYFFSFIYRGDRVYTVYIIIPIDRLYTNDVHVSFK